MKAENLIDSGCFVTGVPDSQLAPLCNYIMKTRGVCSSHIIAANEGNSVAIAAGYHLATGKVPFIYLQNSGIGNIINPVASLLNDKVYGIPCVFIIGWRGEPSTKDEPQHIYQGQITEKLLHDMDIDTFIISPDTTEQQVARQMEKWQPRFKAGKSAAFIVRKNALEYSEKIKYQNEYPLTREEIIEHITQVSGKDIIVSTTGKTSRELFEIREKKGQSHKYDFLTVGSMGHSSGIALGIALAKPKTTVWCIDGDGAALMHMGAMAVIGAQSPKNLIHIVINNAAHESVGGMPTVAAFMDFIKIAKGCGYPATFSADNLKDLDTALKQAKESGELTFIEVKAAIGSRADLGRPTTTPAENKRAFMNYLKELK